MDEVRLHVQPGDRAPDCSSFVCVRATFPRVVEGSVHSMDDLRIDIFTRPSDSPKDHTEAASNTVGLATEAGGPCDGLSVFCFGAQSGAKRSSVHTMDDCHPPATVAAFWAAYSQLRAPTFAG